MRRAGEQGKGTLFERIVSNCLIGLEDGGETLVLGVDQVLLQDATGTLTVQALDALALERVVPGIAVQYVDHNLMQGDFRNADDHRYLRESAAARGIHYSPPGNGISHPVHMELYGRPGYVLVGSDSHTCAAGAIGMLALGLGSLTVAAVLAGAPLRLRRPRVIGVVLQGRLTPGVSAKDVILDVLRRIGTAGGANAVLEYHGPGVATLDAWDRHVIANMGAETGAVTSLFPSDARTAAFLTQVGRSEEMTALDASPEAAYTEIITIDLAALEPLIALPSSPGNVVPVREVEGTPLGQVYLGSSANPGLRDFAAAAAVLGGARIAEGLTLEVNPTTRTVLRDLMASGLMTELIEAGGRLHQTGCNGCNGMGQAPGTGMNSLRTVPRNFPGRSGTREDRVYLCGPETAAASALNGRITDPRRYADRLAAVSPPPGGAPATRRHIVRPPGGETGERFIGPNILPIPVLPPFDALIDVPVILSLGDDVSTDEISPAGAAALPFRSNLERLADFTFHPVDPDYVGRARATTGGHAILAGRNYGQGSSREHAALCPRLLGLKLVVAESFARIHRENLIAAGILPARSEGAVPEGVTRIQMTLDEEAIERGRIEARLATAQGGTTHNLTLDLSEHERAVLMSGGLLYHLRRTDGAHRKAG